MFLLRKHRLHEPGWTEALMPAAIYMNPGTQCTVAACLREVHGGSQFCFSQAKYLSVFLKLTLGRKLRLGLRGQSVKRASYQRPISARSRSYLGMALFLW